MALPTETVSTDRPSAVPGGFREIVPLAFPVVLTQLSATAMGVVDSAMVGRLGPTELAAVGFSSVWIWTIISIFYGTASGVQTFVSQADGAGDPRSCGSWAWQGLYALVPAVLVVVTLVWAQVENAVALLGPSAEMQVAATAYVRARIFGELGFILLMVLSSFFRGIGDTRTPLYVSLGANAVNAVLDYGLIFGELGLPRWGVAGAGVATAVGNCVAAAVLFAAFRRRSIRRRYRTEPIAPSAKQIRRFLRTGAPIGGQWCIGMTSFALFTTVVARMGDTSMAASQAFVMLLSLSFMQAVGISIASSTLVGRYVGAGNPEAVRRSFRSSLVLGAGVAGIVAVLFVTVPGALLRVFTDDPGVVALGRPLLLLGALFQLFDAFAIIAEGALRGAGDTRWPFAIETILGWGFFIPLAYTLGVVLEGGLTGAWVGGLIYIAVLALVLVRRFQSGAWKRIQI
jgi:MATE family multidrug resistance protein